MSMKTATEDSTSARTIILPLNGSSVGGVCSFTGSAKASSAGIRIVTEMESGNLARVEAATKEQAWRREAAASGSKSAGGG